MSDNRSDGDSGQTNSDGFEYDEIRWKVSDWLGRKLFRFLSWLERVTPEKHFRRFDSLESVFANAFHFRFYPYSIILVVILSVMFLDQILTCSVVGKNANFYASTFKIIGTAIFARGLIRGSLGLIRGARTANHTQNYEILNEFEDFEWNRLVSLIYSSIDAVWAVIFALAGYLMEILIMGSIVMQVPWIC